MILVRRTHGLPPTPAAPLTRTIGSLPSGLKFLCHLFRPGEKPRLPPVQSFPIQLHTPQWPVLMLRPRLVNIADTMIQRPPIFVRVHRDQIPNELFVALSLHRNPGSIFEINDHPDPPPCGRLRHKAKVGRAADVKILREHKFPLHRHLERRQGKDTPRRLGVTEHMILHLFIVALTPIPLPRLFDWASFPQGAKQHFLCHSVSPRPFRRIFGRLLLRVCERHKHGAAALQPPMRR